MSNLETAAPAPAANAPANRAISTLSLLFVLQVALAIILKVSEIGYQPVEPSTPLLSCDFAKLTKIVVEESPNGGKNKSKVVLQKEAKGWQLADYYGFPASATAVKQFLDTLKELKKGFPVTTTSGAADRFKVNENNCERAVYLYDDQQKVTKLFLGTSPSFRAVYARTPESDAIYSLDISQYLVDGKPQDWVDKNVAELTADDVVAVDMPAFKLQSNGNRWTLTGAGGNQELHDSVAQELINATAGITINAVLGIKDEPAYNSGNPYFSYRVTLKNGSALTYTFSKPKNESFSVLKISSKEWYLALDDSVVKRIQSITAESLSKKEGEEMKKRQTRAHKDADEAQPGSGSAKKSGPGA